MIRKDLLHHFIGGAIIALLVSLTLFSTFGAVQSAISGYAAAATIGIAKEGVYDGLMKRGTEDIDDIYATTYGGVAGAVVAILLTAAFAWL